MLLPIGDQPNPRGFTPWINYGLILANVAIFFAVTVPLSLRPPDVSDPSVQAFIRELMQRMPGHSYQEIVAALKSLSAYDVFCQHWGYRPATPSMLSLLSSLFLHGDWMHLTFNMLFLWIFGDNVEHRLGRVGYLACYLITGIIATLTFSLFATEGYVPLVGASGAISGVLGFYFVWFPRNHVRIFMWFIFYVDIWLVPVRIVLGFFLIVDNVLPLVLSHGSGGGGVAYGAHLGGFVSGAIIAYVIARVDRTREERHGVDAGRKAATAQEPGKNTGSFGVGAKAVVASHEKGYYPAAIQAYLELLPSQRKQVPAEVIADLGDWLAEHDEPDGALVLYRRGLVDHPRDDVTPRLMLGIGLTLLLFKDRAADAYQYLLDVLDADPPDEIADAARKGLAEIARLHKLRLPRRKS